MPPKTSPRALRASNAVAVVPHKTPTQILGDVALAQAQRSHSEPTSTVELTLNARHDVQIKVVVDDHDPAVAAEKCAELFDVLCAKYPRQENGA